MASLCDNNVCSTNEMLSYESRKKLLAATYDKCGKLSINSK